MRAESLGGNPCLRFTTCFCSSRLLGIWVLVKDWNLPRYVHPFYPCFFFLMIFVFYLGPTMDSSTFFPVRVKLPWEIDDPSWSICFKLMDQPVTIPVEMVRIVVSEIADFGVCYSTMFKEYQSRVLVGFAGNDVSFHRDWVVTPTCNPKPIFGDLANS